MKFIVSAFSALLFSVTCFAQQRALEDVIDDVNIAVLNVMVTTNADEQVFGSGFVIDNDGYVVTNAHVVEDAKNISVSTIYADEYMADLVGTDKITDVALIKINQPLGLGSIHFADSDNVRVGNSVFAVGNPYGLGNSISVGIISAKERDIEKGPYDNFLQTDAAINQGNSGGPLFDMNGEVVGMNTAIFSLQGENMGIGFATPSNMVQWVVEKLKTEGKVERGWLGISVRSVRSKDDPAVLQLAITKLEENSPADKAGLKVGDIIERLGNISLKNPRLFSAEVAAVKPNSKLEAVVRRDGEILHINLQTALMPEENIEKDKLLPPELQSFEELGLDKYKIKDAIEFAQLKMTAYYDEELQEFVVVSFAPNAELADKGIEAGQHLIAANNKKIFGIEDFRIKLKEAEQKGHIELKFKSESGIDSVILKLEEK